MRRQRQYSFDILAVRGQRGLPQFSASIRCTQREPSVVASPVSLRRLVSETTWEGGGVAPTPQPVAFG